MNKYTWFCITIRVDMEVVSTTGNTSTNIFTIILEIHWIEINITFIRTDISNTINHILSLLHCRKQVSNCVVSYWHIVEVETKTSPFISNHLKEFITCNCFYIIFCITDRCTKDDTIFL